MQNRVSRYLPLLLLILNLLLLNVANAEGHHLNDGQTMNINEHYMFSSKIILGSPEEIIEVESIRLEPRSISMFFNESLNIKATVFPSNSTNKDVIWQSSNRGIVQITDLRTFSNQGQSMVEIVGLAPGKAYIIASTIDGEISSSCRVEVVMNPVMSIALEPLEVNMAPGESLFLKANVLPHEGTNPLVTFESNNPGVVSVNEIGLVIAKQPGEARIIVRSVQDDSMSIFCDVSVAISTGVYNEQVEDGESIADLEESESDEIPAIYLYSAIVFAALFVVAFFFLNHSNKKKKLKKSSVNSNIGMPVSPPVKKSRTPESKSSSFYPSIKGLSGPFAGQTIAFVDGQLLIGRDSSKAQLVFPDTHTKISRKHLTIKFNEMNNNFTLIDSSSNGTFLSAHEQLEPGKTYIVDPGKSFYLADPSYKFELQK